MSKDVFAGLPDELQELLDDVDKGSSVVEIKVERKKYGKLWANVSGFDLPQDELKELIKVIKNKLACAGTLKDKHMEILYGRQDRTAELTRILVEQGFNREAIHVTQ